MLINCLGLKRLKYIPNQRPHIIFILMTLNAAFLPRGFTVNCTCLLCQHHLTAATKTIWHFWLYLPFDIVQATQPDNFLPFCLREFFF